MAAKTISVATLVADLAYQADIEGQTGASGRHPQSQLERLINESWQELKETLSDKGYPFFLKAESGTMTAGEFNPDSNQSTIDAAFGTVDMPDDAMRIYGIDVIYQGRRIPLESMDFSQRNDTQDINGSLSTAIPHGYFIYNIGDTDPADETSITTGKIAIFPAPSSAYSYTIYYLPYHTGLTDDTDVYHIPLGFDMWVKWDCICKIWKRDNDSRIADAREERDRQMDRVLRMAKHLQRSGPIKMTDTRGRRRYNRARPEYWP